MRANPMKNLLFDLSAICNRYRIDALYLFGSRAEEMRDKLQGRPPAASSPASDADVGVLPERGIRLSPQDKVRLMADLEDLLDVGRVDLVVLPEASAFLAVDIVSGELVFDRRPDDTARYELYVLRRAGDLLPFQRERIRMVLTEGAT
jgi:predicted nucleotidyltransferase